MISLLMVMVNKREASAYIDDMVEGIFKLSQTDYHLPVNLGNPD